MLSPPSLPQIGDIFLPCSSECPRSIKCGGLPGYLLPDDESTDNLSNEEIARLAGLHNLVPVRQITILVDFSDICIHPKFNGVEGKPGLCFLGSREIEY